MTNSTNTTVKTTQKEFYSVLLEVIAESARSEEQKDALTKFVNSRIEQIEKKKSSASSKSNTELEENKLLILDILADMGRPVQVGEILKEDVPETFSSSKVTSILQKLLAEGKVVNVKDKKKSYYSLADAE